MSDTPRTDEQEKRHGGKDAHQPFRQILFFSRQIERELTMRTALLEQQVAVSNALEKQLVKALDQIKRMDADMLVIAQTLAEMEVTKASMTFLDEAFNSGDGTYRP